MQTIKKACLHRFVAAQLLVVAHILSWSSPGYAIPAFLREEPDSAHRRLGEREPRCLFDGV